MPNNSSKYWPAAAVIAIVLIVAGIQYFKNQKPARENTNQNIDTEQNGQAQIKSEGKTPATVNSFEGVLHISDNLKRGNLMLKTSSHVIYLFTSRDYSSLFGKQVKVEIEGGLDNFKLVDIKAK
ncbi:MAG: hypothetical protein HYZ51_04955 [Candidatus Doudnabacteria bacterium]|nr:hypothetical protein [Candidatus Doudnabacteria bacterium]